MRHIITDDDLHASLARINKIGSPISDSSSVFRRKDTEASSGSGVSSAPQPRAGAAAVRPFNLDACFKMVPANAEGKV